ncbi:uncharacterized protein LOC102781435 [Neolamprologus brichardi]|uniref:uncharacterized protein LOC102781435 n=1 Tax=Neolamprologus brichardi TaxID=32507 RepID=UPI001643D582|nr:uncharacterized protein LOC102781435 [Neolamprologus brichardi]
MATLRITSLFGGVLCACVLACIAEGELSVSSHTRDKKVPAESGNNVTLTCRAPNNKFIVVNWSRADLGEEYVLLYRDEHFDTTKQHPSFKKRVALQDRHMKDGDVSLNLENVTTADAGTYECRIFIEETRSWESICTSHLFLQEDQPGGLRGDGVRRGRHSQRRRQTQTHSCCSLASFDKSRKRGRGGESGQTANSNYTKIIPAQSGQNITLPCRAPNNNIIVVEWSRADLGDEYVLLYRDEQFDPENQHPSFKNRVDLQDRQMKDGDVSLILKNVTINDSGNYECRVFMKRSNRRKRAHLKTNPISIIYLSVVDPPAQTGGHTEDGGKEDPVSTGRSALVAGLSVFGVICGVVAAFLII